MRNKLKIPSWDELFMLHAYLISSKSKDTRTKVGAVLIRDKSIISEGYNGIVNGVLDEKSERFERPEKYFWFEHAERNSVYHCARHGIATEGVVMYTQGIPCSDCARAVVRAGIKEVVVHEEWQKLFIDNKKWEESIRRSKIMFEEAGIKVRVFSKYLGVKSLLDGNIVEV